MISLTVYDTPEDIALYTYDLLTEAAAEAGNATAALSFGSTYEGIFRSWKQLWLNGAGAEHPPKEALPAFFPADERRVDFGHPGSNWGTAWSNFMSECGTEEDRKRWASDPERYLEIIQSYFGGTENAPGLPVFSLIFLGLGPDGHTASLFPGDCPEEDEPDWNEPVLETTAPFDPPSRLTLGPELIAGAKKLVLVVTGESKAGIFQKLTAELAGMEDPSNGEKLRGLLPPARIFRRRSALGLDTTVLCDRAASAETDKSLADRSGWTYDIQTNRQRRR